MRVCSNVPAMDGSAIRSTTSSLSSTAQSEQSYSSSFRVQYYVLFCSSETAETTEGTTVTNTDETSSAPTTITTPTEAPPVQSELILYLLAVWPIPMLNMWTRYGYLQKMSENEGEKCMTLQYQIPWPLSWYDIDSKKQHDDWFSYIVVHNYYWSQSGTTIRTSTGPSVSTAPATSAVAQLATNWGWVMLTELPLETRWSTMQPLSTKFW